MSFTPFVPFTPSEKNCKFLSTIGLLKSTDFNEYEIFDDRAVRTDYLLNMLPRMFDGCSIYICTDLINYFIVSILPKIIKKFVLVSGYSDLTVPNDIRSNVDGLLNNQFLIKWFAIDCKINNNIKVQQLPIGLDYHTLFDAYRNKSIPIWEAHGLLPEIQEQDLMNIRASIDFQRFDKRQLKIYVNFTLNFTDKFNQRHDALAKINRKLMHLNLGPIQRTQTWRNITNYAFVLSPTGFGIDCHRTWEALCLGAIPIVKLPEYGPLFNDLPVLNVNDWSDINKELLMQTVKDFSTRTFNYDKLTLDYWIKLIKDS